MRQGKSPLFDKLYEQAKNLKSKIEDKRNQLMDNLKKKSVPKILKISKKIDRNPNLFSERLYPYHKLAKGEGEEANPEIESEFEYLHVATVRSNPLGISGEYENEEFKNNIDNIFNDVEEIKTLYGNKPEYVKFYRGVRSKRIQKYPFKPDIQVKKGSNSLEHAMKKSEEKKISRSFISNSPCKKIKDLNSELKSNKKIVNNNNNKEFELGRSTLKYSNNIKDKVHEFKENEENKNNLSINSIPKKRTNSAETSSLKKSKDNSNKKVLFAEAVNKEIKKLSYDKVKEIIHNTKTMEKADLNNNKTYKTNKSKDNAYKLKAENKILSVKILKENSIKISEKLYNQGVNLLKKKEKLANEKSQAEKEEFAKFTFMPNAAKKQTKNSFVSKKKDEAENKSLIKNNSFTSGFSKSFDNMIAVKKDSKNSKNQIKIQKNVKSKFPFSSNATDKQNKSKNNPPSTNNNNIEIINNLNNKMKKNNQWQFPNKHAKKIFDSAYIALINNFNSELVNKLNKDSPNEYSTNSSNNNHHHSNLQKNNSNINNYNNHIPNETINKSNNDANNKSINVKESELNSSKINIGKHSLNSKLGENYHTVIDKRAMNNTGIYDRCRRWKENNNKSKSKMREIFEKEQNKHCNFSPLIRKKSNKEFDDRFIRSESKHLDTYIKRRRSSIEHLEEQKNFEKKIFGKIFEKFPKKLTKPEAFNFSHSISRKSKGMRNSAINLHKPEKVKDYRREFKTGNFFNQEVVEFEENINNNNKTNTSVNKSSNNSLIDFYAKNRNSFNKTVKAPNNNFLENNRKKLNENLKMNKAEKKFSNTVYHKNNTNNLNKGNVNLEYRIILEDNREYLKLEETGKIEMKQSCENNIVNTNPADEYNDNVEEKIEEKLLNKDMNVNLNYQLKLNK